MKSIFVVICLVAVGEISAEQCSVPFVIGSFGNCSASSVAVIYFSDSINIPACRLFGDLDFNSTNFLNSWPNITDTCIQQSPNEDIARNLYHTTPSGPGRPLTVAQCQTYVQTMQCRMDCLLTFDLLVPNNKQFAYIHLRAISCNETLFATSIGNIFNNRNNIQPTFTPRQLAEVPVSSATIIPIFSTTTILLPAVSSSINSTTTIVLTTSQLVLQSTFSRTLSPSIQHIVSTSFPSSSQFILVINGGDVGITAAFSTTVAVLIIIALGMAVILVVVLIRYKTFIQNTNENSQKRNDAVILTSPNPVYGYLSNNKGEIHVPKAVHDELETLPGGVH